jgi:hypothetical protein
MRHRRPSRLADANPDRIGLAIERAYGRVFLHGSRPLRSSEDRSARIFERITETFDFLAPIAEVAEFVGPILLLHYEQAVLPKGAPHAHNPGAGQNISTDNSAVAPHK